MGVGIEIVPGGQLPRTELTPLARPETRSPSRSRHPSAEAPKNRRGMQTDQSLPIRSSGPGQKRETAVQDKRCLPSA